MIGYDMYSEPIRRAAMEIARDQGETSISGKVRLVQETEEDVQPGFLMYLPIYRPRAALRSVEGRRQNLVGRVYAPFRIGEWLLAQIEARGGGIVGSVVTTSNEEMGQRRRQPLTIRQARCTSACQRHRHRQ